MEARENLRGSGILLSISSLPSPYGIGTLGREAYNFVDLLGDLKQKYWQVLPVGPTIFGDSPYQPSSGCAGNIYFIDLDKLVDEGLLEKEEILGYNWGTDESEIDYAALHQNRCKILQKAFERFDTNAQEFQDFVKKQSEWLEQYALFMTLKTDNLYKNWSEWSSEYRNPQTVALEKYQKKNYNTITFWKFCQYKFFEQWEDLKNYANSKGVYIIGDISFYVGYDSVDVWAERQLFMMSANDTPEYVAAAGPDKYSESGQVWGNPMYDWDAMKEDNFSWWRKRMRVCRELFDIVRIDHFAGIVKAYAVPYGQDKSLSGKWFKGPGRSAGYYNGDNAEEKTKMAQAMNLLMPGNAFLYYGEEIGMRGTANDETKRLAMRWSGDSKAKGMCVGPQNAEETEQTYDTLDKQMENPYSIYNFVKQTISIRNAFPEIARGTNTFEKDLSNDNVCIFTREYNGEKAVLIFNPSKDEASVDVSSLGVNDAVAMLQTTKKAPSYKDGTAKLPAYSVLVLK